MIKKVNQSIKKSLKYFSTFGVFYLTIQILQLVEIPPLSKMMVFNSLSPITSSKVHHTYSPSVVWAASISNPKNSNSNTKSGNALNQEQDMNSKYMKSYIYGEEWKRQLEMMEKVKTHGNDAYTRYSNIRRFLEQKINEDLQNSNSNNSSNSISSSSSSSPLNTPKSINASNKHNSSSISAVAPDSDGPSADNKSFIYSNELSRIKKLMDKSEKNDPQAYQRYYEIHDFILKQINQDRR